MFKRILNAVSATAIVLSLLSCSANPNEPVDVQDGGGGGGNNGGWGKFPKKPVPVDPLDETAQMMTTLNELSRMQRTTSNSIKERDTDGRVGCILYRVPPETSDQFLIAKYNCLQDDSRKSANAMVREERGTEIYKRTRWISRAVANLLSITRSKADPKTDLTGGDIFRDLTLAYLQQDSSTLTANYVARIRPSVRVRPKTNPGETFILKIDKQEIETPNHTVELSRGFTFTVTYEADPMAVKSAPHVTVFKATTPVTFSENCSRPVGSFEFETSVKNTVIKTGVVVSTAAGFQLQESGSRLEKWPSACLDSSLTALSR